MNITAEQKYQLLLEISQKVRDTLDLDEIMEHILDTIQTVVDYDAGGIFVLNQDLVHDRRLNPTNVIAGVCWRGFQPPPPGEDEMLTHGKGIIGHVIASGESVIAPDVRLDPHYIAGRAETLSEIAVPILRGERAIGALNLESDRLRAYDESHLEVLQFFADAAGIALEKAMLHRQLLQREIFDRQLQTASEVQRHLLPMEKPNIPGYDIAGVCIPADEIGGDYYDYLSLPHGNMGIAVADVSGHGIAAALAMTAFRSLLRIHSQGVRDPANIARLLNRLLPEFTGDSHFITMTYGELSLKRDEMVFASCGHPPTLLLHRNGRYQTLACNGPALGIYPQAAYENENMLLAQNDILVMYTDGVVEIENPAGQAFGVKRLLTVIHQNRKLPAEALIQQVISATRGFSGYQTYLDDFTLVIVKRG